MLDNPKWLLFFATFSVTSVIFMGLLDVAWSGEENVFNQMRSVNGPLDFFAASSALWHFMTWDYAWLEGSLGLVRYVFMIIQFCFALLLIYQGWKAFKGY